MCYRVCCRCTISHERARGVADRLSERAQGAVGAIVEAGGGVGVRRAGGTPRTTRRVVDVQLVLTNVDSLTQPNAQCCMHTQRDAIKGDIVCYCGRCELDTVGSTDCTNTRNRHTPTHSHTPTVGKAGCIPYCSSLMNTGTGASATVGAPGDA